MLNNKNQDLLGRNSVLNIEAQKELIDHTIKASRNNALKMFLVIFPITIATMLIMIGTIFYFTGLFK